MKRVLKHMLFDFDTMKSEEDSHVTISMHAGAVDLLVGVQNHKICLWSVEDESNPVFERRFVVYGTGFALDEHPNQVHVGTVFMGSYVWHVFEQRNVKLVGYPAKIHYIIP